MVIQIVNFPFCNFYSLERYLRVSSHAYQVLSTGETLSISDVIILPGVGTFKQGMEYLLASDLTDAIVEHANAGGRVVGICLGMQMLLDVSAESPGVKGLGLISGICEQIPATPTFSVPHIGWNSIVLAENVNSNGAQGCIPAELSSSDFYFVHSYVAKTSVAEATIASFKHPSGHMAAAIRTGSVTGLQFHPEKSGRAGYSLLNHILGL